MSQKQALTEQEALAERERYVSAFNNTMVNIWAEKITLLGIVDTGQLLSSVKGLVTRVDGRFIEVRLSQAFLEYGIWQDYGTGRETPRGNPGDIGRAKKRKTSINACFCEKLPSPLNFPHILCTLSQKKTVILRAKFQLC